MIKTNGIASKEQPYLTEAVDQKGKKVIINSSRKESEYLSPSQMLEVALAGCFTMTLKGVLFKNGISYEDVYVTVNMNVSQEETTFDIHADIIADLSEEEKTKYIQMTYDQCYVRNILTKPIYTTIK